jgi:hypothetical protein
MKWLRQQKYWTIFESNCDWCIDRRNWCCFKITEKELREKYIEIEPNTDLCSEDDPPGPVSRWYGFVEDIPILLDLHHYIPGGPEVIIYYADLPEAREKIRKQFSGWGQEWQESEIA